MDDIFRRWAAKVDSGISLQRNIHVNADDMVMIQKTEDQLQRPIFTFNSIIPVSYTHLDVYKRQR